MNVAELGWSGFFFQKIARYLPILNPPTYAVQFSQFDTRRALFSVSPAGAMGFQIVGDLPEDWTQMQAVGWIEPD